MEKIAIAVAAGVAAILVVTSIADLRESNKKIVSLAKKRNRLSRKCVINRQDILFLTLIRKRFWKGLPCMRNCTNIRSISQKSFPRQAMSGSNIMTDGKNDSTVSQMRSDSIRKEKGYATQWRRRFIKQWITSQLQFTQFQFPSQRRRWKFLFWSKIQPKAEVVSHSVSFP